MKIYNRQWMPYALAAGTLLALAMPALSQSPAPEPAVRCAALAKPMPASVSTLASGPITVTSAKLVEASAADVPPNAPMQSALPQHCQVLGTLAPLDARAPNIHFQINLPTAWNGRTVQYGGGGFNGVLITGLGLPPAARLDMPGPLARGYVTYGTDSGHQNKPGEALQAFVANEEAFVNFAHASYKKVKDVAMEMVKQYYGKPAAYTYFMGSSEGGREALTMAQRYPADFNGIFSRVPVINWTGLQHAGLRNGLALFGENWIRRPQVKLVSDAVLATCDAIDGIKDNLMADYVSCRGRFDVSSLRCKAGQSGDECLSEGQVKAVQTLHSSYSFDFPLAHGVSSYPPFPLGGENTPGTGPVGGWPSWWLGDMPPAQPLKPEMSRAWVYGAGAILHFYAQNPGADLSRYSPNDYKDRVRYVSELMDATNPDLSAFNARGGKLIMMENMADYAQSPYAGIGYFRDVIDALGADKVEQFMRLYVAPGVDHVGGGAPGNVDMLEALTAWVEHKQAPDTLEVVQQERNPPFATLRELPLCRWPMFPRYMGKGEIGAPSSYQCSK